MAFFKYNRDYKDGRGFLYYDFPPYYIYKRANKGTAAYWKPRQKDFAIGQVLTYSPIIGEKYYLRLLLTLIRGFTGFKDLRIIDGILKSLFREACKDLGLLEDNDEWNNYFNKAKLFSLGTVLRRLFA